MVYSERDYRFFQNGTSIDTMEIWEKSEDVPQNTNPFWLEDGLWFRDEHEFHASAGYTFTLHHYGYDLVGRMSITKREMGKYAIFSLGTHGIYGRKFPVNELVQDTIHGVVFNDCVKIKSNADEFPDRFIYPVEMAAACWSKSKGLLYYEIDGEKYYLKNLQ